MKKYNVSITILLEVPVIYEGDELKTIQQQALSEACDFMQQNMEQCLSQNLIQINEVNEVDKVWS